MDRAGILNQRGIAPKADWDLYRLVSEVREVLQVAPEHVKDSKAAAGTIKKLLGNLARVRSSKPLMSLAESRSTKIRQFVIDENVAMSQATRRCLAA